MLNMERSLLVVMAMCVVGVMSEMSMRDVRGPPRQSGVYESRQVVKVGQQKKRLVCPVEADQNILISWYKGEDLIDDFWSRYKVSKDSSVSLRIKDIEMDDSGVFICKVSNGFGTIQFNFTLIVIDPGSGLVHNGDDLYAQSPDEDLTKAGSAPYFIDEDRMLKKKVHERPVGSSLRLRCNAEGNPLPSIRWYKGGTEVTYLGDEGTHRKHSTLKLRDLMESDSGDYQCVVTNKLGSASFTYKVDVIAKITMQATLIGPHPQNETVPVGGQATFQCKVKSKVKPHIQWLKRLDHEMEHNLNKTNIVEVKNQKFLVLNTDDVHPQDGFYVNKLIIKNVKPSDVGMYICMGTNALGYSFRSAFLAIDGDAVDGLGGDSNNLSGRSTGSVGNGSLPLIIAVPACVAIVVVAAAIYILQRRGQCSHNSNTHRNTRFNAVPTQEREGFTPPAPNNARLVAAPTAPPIGGTRPVDKLNSNKTHSLSNIYSDISSVSRCHHHQGHSNHQYGY